MLASVQVRRVPRDLVKRDRHKRRLFNSTERTGWDFDLVGARFFVALQQPPTRAARGARCLFRQHRRCPGEALRRDVAVVAAQEHRATRLLSSIEECLQHRNRVHAQLGAHLR